MRLPLILTAAALLGACNAPALPEDQRIDGIDWILIEANGAPWLDNVTLWLEGDRLSGVGPCNAYSGRREGTAPAFGALDLNATRMACADPSRMQAERNYLALLPRAQAIERQDDLLVLSGPGVELVFTPREARGDEVF